MILGIHTRMASIICSLVVFNAIPNPVNALEDTKNNESVVIHQVQTGTTQSASSEYVSIFNNSDKEVNVSNWCLQYTSASASTKSVLLCLNPPDARTELLLPPQAYISFATKEFLQTTIAEVDYQFTASLASSGGHISLLNASKEAVDVVGWGSASKPEEKSAAIPSNSKVLQRIKDNNSLIDSQNNYADFMSADLIIVDTKNIIERPIQLTNIPAGLVISEVYPDAIGSDEGKEFIEIYNGSVTDINLNGYQIQVGPTFSKTYVIGNVLLNSSMYLSLGDNETGLTLPNTSASIRLLTPDNQLVVESKAYSEMKEGTSWVLVNDMWLVTHAPTPGAENIVVLQDDCNVGSILNAMPILCNITKTNNIPKVCNPDQIRNEETGRCRKIPTNTTSTTACKPNQLRNPETGRCKNIVDSKSNSCPPGQERNPQTQRCRKNIPPINKANVKDVKAPLVENSPKWWIAGVAAASVTGYGAIEWRREIISLMSVVKTKIMG